MKIDGRCHCGFITFEAEADPEQDCNLPLCGPSEFFRLGVSRARAGHEWYIPHPLGGTDGLCEDSRQRHETRSSVLPSLRIADLCNRRR